MKRGRQHVIKNAVWNEERWINTERYNDYDVEKDT